MRKIAKPPDQILIAQISDLGPDTIARSDPSVIAVGQVCDFDLEPLGSGRENPPVSRGRRRVEAVQVPDRAGANLGQGACLRA